MRFVFLTILLLISFQGLTQDKQLSGRLTIDPELTKILDYRYFTIQLKIGDSIVSAAISDATGHYSLNHIVPGIYSLAIHQIGNRDVTIDTLVIISDTTIDLNYPGKCKYVYKRGEKPICIGGHTDFIIPISYGLPTKKTMEKAKDGLLYLGGCIITGCDPHYYCTLHKREF